MRGLCVGGGLGGKVPGATTGGGGQLQFMFAGIVYVLSRPHLPQNEEA